MRMRLCHYQGCGKVATQAGAGGAVRFWCDKHVHLDRPFGNLGKAFDRIMVSLCVILCLFVVLLFGFTNCPSTVGATRRYFSLILSSSNTVYL